MLAGACEQHEIVTPEQPEYIIGEWELEKIVIAGIEQNLSDCHKRSRMAFDADGNAEFKYYTTYEPDNECVLHLHYQGKWKYENGKFLFRIEYSNTSADTNLEMEKELYFTDPDHFYIEMEYGGYIGKLYFEKYD